MTKSRKFAYTTLLCNALIWGAAFPIVKPVFDFLTPMQYLYFRFLIAGILSLPIFLYYYYKIHPKISYIVKVLLLELAGTILPLYILYEGLAKTSALEASLISATGPIFIILAGMYFLHERETRREWQGLALALLGSLAIVLEPVFLGQHGPALSAMGNLYILIYNLLNAVYVIIAKKIYRTHPPLYMGSLTYLTTALIYGLILSHAGSLPPLNILYSTFSVLIPILYMAIPGTLLAFLFYQYAASKIEVGDANLFTYLHGVVAIPASFLLLGEKPSIFTVCAVIAITYWVLRAESRQKKN